MALSLSPQCCCDGPGITRVGGSAYTIRPINPGDDLDEFGRTKRWPCWAVYVHNPPTITYHGEQGFPFLIAKPNLGHVMGLRTTHNWLIGGGNGVVANRLNECALVADGGFPGGGGISPVTVIIDEADGLALYESTFPGGSAAWDTNSFFGGTRAVFSCASDTRLYGHSRYGKFVGDDLERHFKVWSVDYTGGDYTEHFTVDGDFDTLIPDTINVQNGGPDGGDRIFCCYKPVADYTILEGGSGLTTLTGLSDQLYPSVANIGGQSLLSIGGLGTSGLFIIDGASAYDDNPVRFVASEDGDDVEYVAGSMTYDPTKKAVVVVWSPSIGSTPLALSGYVTYITKPLSAGNIITQDGVFIYANYVAGNGIGEDVWVGNNFRTAGSWATAIPGKLPRPLTVTDGVIEPPPPPPPPTPTCDPLTDCDPFPDANFGFVSMHDHDFTSIDDLHRPVILHTLYHSNLERTFTMPKVSDLSFPCAGAISGEWLFEVILGDEGNYSDPGILIKWFEYTAPADSAHKRETYVHRIGVAVSCSDGNVTIERVAFANQTFEGDVGSTWPTAVDVAGCNTPLRDHVQQAGLAGYCTSTFMSSWINGDIFPDDNFDGTPLSFLVYGSIGAASV